MKRAAFVIVLSYLLLFIVLTEPAFVACFIGRPDETKYRKDIPAGIMRATISGISKEFVERSQDFALVVTQLGDGNYINLFDGAALDQSKHKTWDKSAIKGHASVRFG